MGLDCVRCRVSDLSVCEDNLRRAFEGTTKIFTVGQSKNYVSPNNVFSVTLSEEVISSLTLDPCDEPYIRHAKSLLFISDYGAFIVSFIDFGEHAIIWPRSHSKRAKRTREHVNEIKLAKDIISQSLSRKWPSTFSYLWKAISVFWCPCPPAVRDLENGESEDQTDQK